MENSTQNQPTVIIESFGIVDNTNIKKGSGKSKLNSALKSYKGKNRDSK